MSDKESRTIGLYFKVSPKEKELIHQKMNLCNITNQRAYLRKMAIDGYIIYLDLSFLKEMLLLLRKSSDNINQIAHRVNTMGNFYAEDLKDLQQKNQEIWNIVNIILEKLNAL